MTTLDLWHCRLCHLSVKILKQVVNFLCLPDAYVYDIHFCDSCQYGKSHYLPFKRSINKTISPLQLVHVDPWGLALLFSIEG